MLIKELIGNLAAFDVGSRHIDYVDVHWNECGRFLKRSTRSGRSVRIILPSGLAFGHNDILIVDDHDVVAVNIVPSDVIVARPDCAAELARLALELGNLHLPVEIENDRLMFIESREVTALLNDLKIDWSKEHRRFKPSPILSLPKLGVSPDCQVIVRTESDQARSSDTSACAATTTA